MSNEKVEDFYKKVYKSADRIKNNNVVFSELFFGGLVNLDLPNKSVIRNVHLWRGKCGLINFTYYTCLISIHSDRQSEKCLMWELENESKGLEERTAFLNAFVASLLALDLTDSEFNYILKNLESTGRANVWSSKNNNYIVVISTENSFSIFASDTKLF